MLDGLPLFVRLVMLLLAVSAVFLAPFALFLGRSPLSGRKVLGFFAAMFGVIIAVNIYMAVTSISTFPGLEVANSYVASQNFDKERSAQQALGWTAKPEYSDGELRVSVLDIDGQPAPVHGLRVTVSRPTQKRDDVSPQMQLSQGIWSGRLALAPGAWVVHLEADAPGGTVFRQRISDYPGSTVKG